MRFVWTAATSVFVSALSTQSFVAALDYDVIVIGSGAGGLATAEFLTRDPNVHVLMLEAGLPSVWESGGRDSVAYMKGQNLTKFDVPGEYSKLIYNPENAKYRMDWIKGAANMWLGKVVGGCSSIHASLYFHTPDSYLDNCKWPFPKSHVDQLFHENEKLFQVTDLPSPDQEFYLPSAYKILQQALEVLGYKQQSSLNDDHSRNHKSKTFGRAPYTIQNGLRDVPAKFFYAQMKQRANFKLITEAVVSHIVQTKGKASGVVYNNNIQVNLTPTGAVVVAAGALNTPKVLIQSGIGPKDQLDLLHSNNLQAQFPGVHQSFQSQSWILNENVGKHLFDTNVVFATFQHPQMDSFRYGDRPQWAIDQYMKNQQHTGPFASPGPVMIAYENYPVNNRDYEFQITVLPNGFWPNDRVDHTFTTALYVNNPESRDFSSFDTDGSWRGFTRQSLYMATPNDLQAMQSYATRVINTLEANGAKFMPDQQGQSVSDWVASHRNHITHHFGGSCYTASDDAQDSQRCADAKFRVIGTTNIFVGDASLMKLGTTNPYGFVMQIGRQAGELVKEYLQTSTSSPSPPPPPPPPTPTPTPTSTSNGACVLQQNVDFVGQDLYNVPATQPSDCCDKCRQFYGKGGIRCGAFTWTNYMGGTCWLKSQGSKTVWKRGAVSSTVSY